MKRLAVCMIMLCGMFATPSSAGAVVDSVTSISVPEPELTRNSQLSSVSCVSASFCMAVGYKDFYNSNFSTSTIAQTHTVLWNGKSWSGISSPNVGNIPNRLMKVSCVTTSFCKAVGWAGTSTSMPLAMTWNGLAWTLDPTSDLLTSALAGVSCVSTNACVAVGSQRIAFLSQTVVAKWDGATWALQSSPNSSSNQNNVLYSVSCVEISFCTSVGVFQNSSNVNQTLILYWDGNRWFIPQSPNMGSNQSNDLTGVSCTSPFACLAVGSWGTTTASSAKQSLALVWDGRVWTLGQSLNTAAERPNNLSGVSCVSASNCLTVGTGGIGPVTQVLLKSLLLRSDGNSFKYVVTPEASNDQSRNSFPYSVSCVSIDWCMVVGTFDMPYGQSNARPMSLLLSPAAAVVTVPVASSGLAAKRNQTFSSPKLTKTAGLSVPRGAKVTLTVSSKYKKVCKVVGTTVKTVGKGTCPVKVVVTTKTKKKTSKTVTIKVG